MKLLASVACILVSLTTLADCHMGVVAGKGISCISNALSSGTIDIWVAGTRAGTLLQRCQVNDLSATAPFVFKGSRCLSTSFGFDPLVGNTAELWVEGYLDVPGGPSGSEATTTEYFHVELFHPQNLSAPILSRLYVAINLAALSVSSVCANTTGGGVEYSKRGSAYRRSATTGVTNRLTVVETHFLVTGSDNGTYLFDFTYEETTASAPNAFQGDRAIGFRCSNEGAFGKEAEIWLEGSLGGG